MPLKNMKIHNKTLHFDKSNFPCVANVDKVNAYHVVHCMQSLMQNVPVYQDFIMPKKR